MVLQSNSRRKRYGFEDGENSRGGADITTSYKRRKTSRFVDLQMSLKRGSKLRQRSYYARRGGGSVIALYTTEGWAGRGGISDFGKADPCGDGVPPH